MVETDGPYAGYTCSNASHIHHHGEADSVYMQTKGQGDFYRELRNRGVFINAPDGWQFQGINKEGIGYNENQFSLPRAEQLVITRTTLFQNTFLFPPTAGWSFVPLVPYHAGGGGASFWPPSAHLKEYELAIAMHMSYGVAACYRGPGLYDTPAVMQMVKGWVSWFKTHRRVLTSDIIHVRRPDGQAIDGILHADASGSATGGSGEIAMACFFNPATSPLNASIALPLYYAGVAPGESVEVSRSSPQAKLVAGLRQPRTLVASARSRVLLQVAIEAGGFAMFLVKKKKA